MPLTCPVHPSSTVTCPGLSGIAQRQTTPTIGHRRAPDSLVMRRSGVRFPKAARRSSTQPAACSGRLSRGSAAWLDRSGRRLVRIWSALERVGSTHSPRALATTCEASQRSASSFALEMPGVLAMVCVARACPHFPSGRRWMLPAIGVLCVRPGTHRRRIVAEVPAHPIGRRSNPQVPPLGQRADRHTEECRYVMHGP